LSGRTGPGPDFSGPVIDNRKEHPSQMELWSLKKSKILIVDDFSEMRAMMRQMVISLGAVDIHLAKNGEDAVCLMRKQKFDIVLCDYNLGDGKDGQQILEDARHGNLLPENALFIMITAENTSLMVMGAMEYYPDDYLSKPFTKTTLMMRLRKLMDQKAAQRDIINAVKRKDYDLALQLCDDATAYESKYRFQILKLKGDILTRLERYAEAEQLYEEILEERDLSWAMLALGQVYFHSDRFTEAQEIFEEIIENNDSYMAAYDWLAITLKELGNQTDSQDILKQAVAKSPKALLRQRMLGELSLELDDYETSELAYKNAVEYGRNSCFKDVKDYSLLSKSYTEQGKNDNALNAIKKLRRDYRGDAVANVHGDIIESDIHIKSGQHDKAEQLIEKATQFYQDKPESFNSDMCLSLANSCLAVGKTDEGAELIKHTVRNNHDDSRILEQAKQVFAAAGMESEGDAIIASTRQEVVNLNNKGVQLAEDGKIEESIELFVKAAKAMPDNILINLNAAQSILFHAKKHGIEPDKVQRAQSFLERARNIDEEDEKLQKLMATFKSLTADSPKKAS
jgi:tetratricopeptide (TPR) repeat protein